jgi:LemA protein
MEAVQTFENMIRISRLICNVCVAELSREIRMFPVSMIAGMLGFRLRDYLEEQAAKAD